MGFEGPVPGRKHQHMIKGDLMLMLPNPHHDERISIDLLTEILRKAKVTRDEWRPACPKTKRATSSQTRENRMWCTTWLAFLAERTLEMN